MTNNYYPKLLFYSNNYYIVLYYITITISFNYIIFTTFQFVFLSIFVFPCHITASYNHVIISYYCASDFLSVNNGNDIHEIKAIENNKPVRFLGVWVSEYGTSEMCVRLSHD